MTPIETLNNEVKRLDKLKNEYLKEYKENTISESECKKLVSTIQYSINSHYKAMFKLNEPVKVEHLTDESINNLI